MKILIAKNPKDYWTKWVLLNYIVLSFVNKTIYLNNKDDNIHK